MPHTTACAAMYKFMLFLSFLPEGTTLKAGKVPGVGVSLFISPEKQEIFEILKT